LLAATALKGSDWPLPLAPAGAKMLDKPAGFEPRRDFKTVPMILDHRDQWDADALGVVSNQLIDRSSITR